ncbi:MAG TPA: prepilin peptidase [Trinickia sp.]|uniref:A24 family peptidase n=1 Tax=Trinickia sp. TaxID=2571163 RepID=UPI002C1BA0F5|nr:prepilin peptidase [Trinickia sp.]HVW50128.1 prepilin peptidase [Trinickia sp.]
MNAVLFPIGPCVLALVVIAMAYDLHARRIPNWLVATALLAALPAQALAHGVPMGPLWWIGGALMGGLLLMPGYLIRMLGAGDVKLMAAVGALLGPRGAFEAALAATVVGGVLSLLALMQRRRLRRGVASAISMLITNSATPYDSASTSTEPAQRARLSVGSLPYGVAIAIGSVIALLANA